VCEKRITTLNAEYAEFAEKPIAVLCGFCELCVDRDLVSDLEAVCDV
jgi:hypothetical protein